MTKRLFLLVGLCASVSYGGIVVSGGGGVSPDATNQVLLEANAFTTNTVAAYLPIVSTNAVQITGSLSVNGTNVLGTAGGTNVYNTIVTNTYVSNSYSFAVSSTYTGTVVNGMLRLADDAGVYRASGQWESPTITSASGFTGLTMSALSVSGKPYNSPVTTSTNTAGLVAYYSLDNSAVDKITGSNGTLSGDAKYTNSAIIGSHSVTLDGGGDFFATVGSDLLNGATGLTLTCWTFIRSYNADDGLFCSRGSMLNGVVVGATPSFLTLYINNQQFIFSTPTSFTGSWNHIAATWSTNGSANFYFNGSLLYSTSSWYKGGITNTDFFKVGTDDFGTREIDGIFDEVQIYSRPISQDEVTRLYANGSGKRYQVSLNSGSFNGPDGTTNTFYTDSAAIGATQTTAKVRVGISANASENATPRIYNIAMLHAGGGATVFDTVGDFAQGSFTNTLVDTEPAFPTNMAYVSDIVAATSGAASVVYVTNAVAVATNALYTNSIEWTYVLTTNSWDWTEANLLHDGTNYCLPLPAHIPADVKEVGVGFVVGSSSVANGQGLTIQSKFTTYSNTPTLYFPRSSGLPAVNGIAAQYYFEVPVVDRSISYRSNIPASGRIASIKIIKYRR